MNIDAYLDDLEARIDLAEERRIRGCWQAFLSDFRQLPLFDCVRNPVQPGALAMPEAGINQAIESSGFDFMLMQQLNGVEKTITGTVGLIPMIRANYGSVIIPVQLGCRIYLMDEVHQTLPTAYALDGGFDAVKAMMDKGLPALDRGYLAKALDCSAYFREKLAAYPKLSECVRIYHPDFQSPLDIAELLCGSELFMAFYDDPDFVSGLLDYIVQVYMLAMDRFQALVPDDSPYGWHYGWMHRGKIRMSFDSCVNFSSEMYREAIMPFDRKLVERYGAVIHSCGHVDHFVGELNALGAGYHGFNLSQPHLNDMEKIYRETVDRGVRIFSLSRETAELAVRNGRDLHGLVSVF